MARNHFLRLRAIHAAQTGHSSEGVVLLTAFHSQGSREDSKKRREPGEVNAKIMAG
jgi:hypothetical protein